MFEVALDVDGVIADCATPVYETATRILRRELPKPEHWHSYSFAEAMGLTDDEQQYLMDQIKREDTLPWKIQLYPGAKDFVSQLVAKGHDVFFLTAPWDGLKSWVVARTELLESVFPGLDIVFTSAKHRAHFGLLVDDRVQTVVKCKDRAVLFTQPWNVRVKTDVSRVSSHSEVLKLVEGL